MRRSELLKASPPMFQSRLLDRFTRVHPVVPVLIYGPVVVVMLVLAVSRDGWWDTAGLVLLGYALWTLFEYWLHRLVFHFEPEKGIGARLHWMIHGVHHDHPNDPLRLVMPPAASIPLAIVVIGAMFLIFGSTHAPAVAASAAAWRTATSARAGSTARGSGTTGRPSTTSPWSSSIPLTGQTA